MAMNRNTLLSLYIFAALLLIPIADKAQHIPDSLLHRTYATLMHTDPSFTHTGKDSVRTHPHGEYSYYDADTLFYHIATRSRDEMCEELHYFYSAIAPYLSAQQREEVKKSFYRTKEKMRNRDLTQEGEFMMAFLVESKFEERQERAKIWESMLTSEPWKNDAYYRQRIMQEILAHLIVDREYVYAFKVIGRILPELENGEMPDANRRYLYFLAGDLYYHFRDYKQAIPLLEKALTTHSRYFFDRTNLRARNTLGIYYRSIDDLHRSDSYFLSMLQSPDQVKYRPMYDAIAIANLGHNCLARMEYDEAIRLYRIAMPTVNREGDNSFGAGIATGLGKCYLAKGDMTNTKRMIDSVQVLLGDGMRERELYLSQYCSLYPVMAKYYARMGDTEQANRYIDSTVTTNARYRDRFSGLIIRRAEQEVSEKNQKIQAERLDMERSKKLFFAAMALIALLGIAIILPLYNKKRKAYRRLVIQMQQWAQVPDAGTQQPVEPMEEELVKEEKQTSTPPQQTDLLLMEQIERLMKEKVLFKTPELSLDMLADKLEMSRYYVSQAINRCTQKNFNTYVNEYRVKEAIRIMSGTQADRLSIDDIGSESGFNDRRTFYRFFKRTTGMSPTAFRDNLPPRE